MKLHDYHVDGRAYGVSVSDGPMDEEDNVHLRVAFRALFGKRSICQVRGITNRSYWHDYPNVEQMRARAISVTPSVVCELIRLAHRRGWDPESHKSNYELFVTQEEIRSVLESV